MESAFFAHWLDLAEWRCSARDDALPAWRDCRSAGGEVLGDPMCTCAVAVVGPHFPVVSWGHNLGLAISH